MLLSILEAKHKGLLKESVCITTAIWDFSGCMRFGGFFGSHSSWAVFFSFYEPVRRTKIKGPRVNHL